MNTDANQTARLKPHSWVDEDGRKHTTFLVWSEHLCRWCVSASQNGSVGSPNLIPLPDVTPTSPTESDTQTDVPTGWLAAVVKLLDVMAGEGIFMEDCEDPADLMIQVADHLGVGDADDVLEAAVLKLSGVTNER